MKIIIVSNRLPLTVIKKNNTAFRYQPSAGGLASGLKSFVETLKSVSPGNGYSWVGWTGTTVPKSTERIIRDELETGNMYPVFLTENTKEKYYNGFCNRTIWPLFHYFTSLSLIEPQCWEEYKKVNRLYAEEIIRLAKPEDIIFIHDFHLMLLPGYLRKKLPGQTIGFFLHIPFPSYEVYKILPVKWRVEILNGLLGADLIGFHTLDYTQYFLSCIARILGYGHSLGTLDLPDRIVRTITLPLGIDYQKYSSGFMTKKARNKIKKLDTLFGNNKIILSVDRLDYTKGITERLAGYEIFLHQNQKWQKRVTMILVLVPSRTGVESYQAMKKKTDELVGRINGKFGTIDWTPILYQYTSVNFDALEAYYRKSDIALITPIRDGMNLIAKEFVAAKKDGGGVLILSETAGAAKELTEAVIINPNKEEIAEAIATALVMPLKEQRERLSVMNDRLSRNPVHLWGRTFIDTLVQTKTEQAQFIAKRIRENIVRQLMDEYRKAKQRLILLDYDGTLISYRPDPAKAVPPKRLLSLLKKLSSRPGNDVVLVSGRDTDIMERWFRHVPIGLVTEHGAMIRIGSSNWIPLTTEDVSWKKDLFPIFRKYSDWLTGSFIEEKNHSLAWHYRKSDPYLSGIYESEFMNEISQQIGNTNLQILKGNKVIEVKSASIHKGAAIQRWLAESTYDFILAIGDDVTDEDMFTALPQDAYTIKVGTNHSRARYTVATPVSVRSILGGLAQLKDISSEYVSKSSNAAADQAWFRQPV